MQLQKDLGQIKKAGIQVVAISYDPVDALAKFAKKQKITYPLLSDPASKVIKAYGIFNEQAPQRIKGIPHPGTYIVNEKGIVHAKIFLDGYRKRHSAKDLITAAK